MLISTVGTHCIDPPEAEASKDIEYHPDVNVTGMTAVDSTVQYVCKPGHYFTDDRTRNYEELTCRANNTWEGVLTECWKSEIASN